MSAATPPRDGPIKIRKADNVESVARPERLGDALWALGREIGLTEDEVRTIENDRDRAPAKPVDLA